MVCPNCCLSFFVVSPSNFASLSPVDEVSPLCVEQFVTELTNHPDEGKVVNVVEGLHQGFHLGLSHNTKLKSAKRNKPSSLMYAKVVVKYLANKVSHGRVAGPFASPLLQPLHISSFGVIPRKGQPGKWRLIVDLSSPGGASINDFFLRLWQQIFQT